MPQRADSGCEQVFFRAYNGFCRMFDVCPIHFSRSSVSKSVHFSRSLIHTSEQVKYAHEFVTEDMMQTQDARAGRGPQELKKRDESAVKQQKNLTQEEQRLHQPTIPPTRHTPLRSPGISSFWDYDAMCDASRFRDFSDKERVIHPRVHCPWDTHYQFSIKTLLSKKRKSLSAARCGGTWDLDPVDLIPSGFFYWIFFFWGLVLAGWSPPFP